MIPNVHALKRTLADDQGKARLPPASPSGHCDFPKKGGSRAPANVGANSPPQLPAPLRRCFNSSPASCCTLHLEPAQTTAARACQHVPPLQCERLDAAVERSRPYLLGRAAITSGRRLRQCTDYSARSPNRLNPINTHNRLLAPRIILALVARDNASAASSGERTSSSTAKRAPTWLRPVYPAPASADFVRLNTTSSWSSDGSRGSEKAVP